MREIEEFWDHRYSQEKPSDKEYEDFLKLKRKHTSKPRKRRSK